MVRGRMLRVKEGPPAMSIALRDAGVLPLRPASLSFTWLPERQRLDLAFTGDVTGGEYLGVMRRCFQAHPDSVLADWVHDLRRYRGTVGHDEVSALARDYHALARGRDERALSVLVTPDPGFVHWAAVWRVQFRPRRVAVVATMAEAEALLAAPAC